MISRDGHCPSYQGAYCLERETHQIVTGMQRAIPHWRPHLEGGQGRQGTGSQKQGLGWYPVWDGSVAAGPGEPLRTQNWVPRGWGGGEAASLTPEIAWKRVMHSHDACPTYPSCRLRVATRLSLGRVRWRWEEWQRRVGWNGSVRGSWEEASGEADSPRKATFEQRSSGMGYGG